MGDGKQGLAVGMGLVAILVVGFLFLSGSQVSRILSTVGGSVGTPGGAVGAAPPYDPPEAGSTSGQGEVEPPAALRDEAKIVYTGSLELVVTDLPATLSSAREVIGGLDGYVGASRETNDGTSPTATITFRIPADRWDRGVAALRALAAKVVREETSATEVTGELVDLEARIRNLRSSETALQAIAANTAKVSDLLGVQRELTTVRGEIERLDAQRASLVDQTAYGTLEATFGLEVIAVQEAAKGWDPATEVDRASASLVSVVQTTASAAIWFGILWLPILLVLGIGIATTLFVLRRLRIIGQHDPLPG